MKARPNLSECFAGLLLGTAVGDALGLPAEGMTRGRIQRLYRGNWRHRFVFGRGMWSDDTEHTIMVAQSLLAHPDNVTAFQRSLAWKLRWWLLGLPAGVGLATARAIFKLWLGFPPSRSGVHSAGNGPAMRSAILGAYFFDDALQRKEFVSAATRLTHTDPKAEIAALAIAEAAAAAGQQQPIAEFLQSLSTLSADTEWVAICDKLKHSLANRISVAEFADSLRLNNGVTGYCYHTVPVALYAWLRHEGDFPTTLASALDCGGDTDTVGAIVGALAGATCGPAAIPSGWLNRISEWPRSTNTLIEIGERLARQKTEDASPGPVNYFWPGLVPRNLAFLLIVLAHGFRRLLPPY